MKEAATRMERDLHEMTSEVRGVHERERAWGLTERDLREDIRIMTGKVDELTLHVKNLEH